NRLNLEWNLQRTISKINYQIHTNAIKENLVPKEISQQQTSFVYANEADLLNVALFGITAKEWRENNPNEKGNIRDFATLEQLVVLSNMESINALLIQQGLSQSERLIHLNKVAITQMTTPIKSKTSKKLKELMISVTHLATDTPPVAAFTHNDIPLKVAAFVAVPNITLPPV